MRLFRLSTVLVLFMLTGALDYLISALPLVATVWVFGSALLALTGLASWPVRDRGLELARMPLGK